MSTTWYHMAIGNLTLIRQIREDGASKCLENFMGTDQEAIDAINAEERSWFTIGNCDNQKDDGSCSGHTSKPEKEST